MYGSEVQYLSFLAVVSDGVLHGSFITVPCDVDYS